MGAGSSPSSLSPAPSLVLSKEIIVATPQPGTYTRDGITRVVTSPSVAVNLTRDGWTPVEEKAAAKASSSDSPKPTKPTEN